MKQFFTLLKADYLDTFKLNRIRYGKDEKQRKKQIRGLVAMVILAIFCAFSIYGYFYVMAVTLKGVGAPELVLSIGCFTACAITALTSVMHAKSTLIAFRDYDAVMSLPVSGMAVAWSRMAKLYTTNLLFILAVMIPSGVAYVTVAPQGVSFYVLFVVTLFIAPLLPIAAAGVLGILIGMATVRFKRKQLAGTILSFIFLIAVMSLSFFSSSILDNMEEIAPKLVGTVQRAYPPAVWYGAALTGDWGKLLLFIAVNILPFAAFGILAGVFFRPLNAIMTRQRRFSMKRERMTAKSPLTALYKKEIKRYFSSTIYVTNTAFGAILYIAAGIAAIAFGRDRLLALINIPELSGMLMNMLPLAASLFAALSCTTGSSISLEREKLWLLKALPVNPNEIFLSKLGVYATVMLPSILVGGTLLSIVFAPDALTAALMFLTPAAYVWCMGVLGLTLDLAMPKLSWQNEAEVVKQSIPNMIVALGGLIVTVIPMIICGVTGISWLTPAWTALVFIIGLILWSRLMKKGGARLMAI